MINLTTLSRPRKVCAVNATSASYPSRVVTATEPTGTGVIDIGGPGVVQNGLRAVFYGTGAADNAFNVRILGWNKLGDDPETAVWFYVTLAEIAAIMGTSTGVGSRLIGSTELLCDTISIVGTSANDDVNISIVSPADNTVAHLTLDTVGCPKVEFIFDQTTGSPTGFNALVSLL